MKVIFEGVNRSGKTTVARMLCDQLSAKYVKVRNRQDVRTLYGIEQQIIDAGYKPNAFYEDVMVMETVEQIFPGPQHRIFGGVVLDRSLISAIVYNDLYSENLPIPEEVLHWWMGKVLDGGWVHVVLDCSYGAYILRENGNAEADGEHKFNTIRSSIMRLAHGAKLFGATVLFLDTTHTTPVQILEQVIQFFNSLYR
jgi:hypothetical protein